MPQDIIKVSICMTESTFNQFTDRLIKKGYTSISDFMDHCLITECPDMKFYRKVPKHAVY